MIVLVPVSRFRVTYEVAAGRPFSQLERMVLGAAHEGACDLAALEQTFQVHRRILIEALVTLTQAGWLSVSGPEGGGFVLTSEGRDAAAGDRPPSTTVVSSKRMLVVMERLSGGLVANDEVRFFTKRDLEPVWDSSLILRADVLENSIDEGQVQHLLRRAPEEWVRWIGPIDMVSKNAHWVAVNVDPDTGAVVGLPDAWRPRLTGLLADEAHRYADRCSAEAKARTWTPPRGGSTRGTVVGADDDRAPAGSWRIQIGASDLRFTTEQHGNCLLDALRAARSSVLIASAFVGRPSLEILRPHLLDALGRGVDVDLLWGYSADEAGGSSIEWLRKLAVEAKRASMAGTLRFNPTASGSHAKLLLHDSSSGCEAWVGSFNWLSGFAAGLRTPGVANVSVHLADPGIVSAIARCAAGLWAGVDLEALSSTADRWRRTAAELEMSAQTSQQPPANGIGETRTTARLVLDREHESLLREWTSTAQHRLLICSHRLGPAAEVRLVAAGNRSLPSRVFRVRYDEADITGDALSRAVARVTEAGGVINRVAGLHAKVLVSDVSACISSYNFLSADPFGRAMHTREIGVVFDSPPIADNLWAMLGS